VTHSLTTLYKESSLKFFFFRSSQSIIKSTKFNWKPSASAEFSRNFIRIEFYQASPTKRAGTYRYKLQTVKQVWRVRSTTSERLQPQKEKSATDRVPCVYAFLFDRCCFRHVIKGSKKTNESECYVCTSHKHPYLVIRLNGHINWELNW
jgi:hypothetical protein